MNRVGSIWCWKQWFMLVGLVFLLPAGLLAQSDEDDLLNSLTNSIGADTSIASADSRIVINDIDIRITGTTDPAWVRTQLLFSKDASFSPEAWLAMAQRQTDLLKGTSLFYQVRVYIQPRAEGGFRAVIELTDGFMFGFGFWPWDLSVAFKHLLKGQDRLDVTLGLNTQAVAWDHPFVAGTPFGYSANVGHSFTYQKPGWLLESIDAGGQIYYSWGPLLRIGANLRLKDWTLPQESWLEPELTPSIIEANRTRLGITDAGGALMPGLAIQLWPDYQFQTPVGIHADIAAGAILGLDDDSKGWYTDGSLILFARPLEALIVHMRLAIDGRYGPISPVLFPDTSGYRSSEWLSPGAWLTEATLQLTGARVLSRGLGFTTLYFSPFVYLETAQTTARLKDWSFDELHLATGGGIDFEFGLPINLIFSLGIKASLVPSLNPAILFSVESKLF